LDILGLKGLHLLLLDRGVESTLLYLPRLAEARDWERRLASFVAECQPRFIGISVMANDFETARTITSALKSAHPAIPVAWGGIHATTSPESCAEYADYACVGEAEQTLLDMVCAAKEGRSFDSIANLAFVRDGVFHQNPLHPLVEDLDTLPIGRQIPDRSFIMADGRIELVCSNHLRRYRRYRGALYKLLTSRGCPHNCTYCCNHFLRQLYGRWPVRRRSVEHVMTELETALHEGPTVEYVDFTDDCFLASDLDYLAEFCQQYKTRIGRPFIVKGTPRYFTKEKMDRLTDAGLGWINMGLQSGSDRVCREIYNRRLTAEDFIEAARLIGQYPVAAYYDLIVDNPLETTEDSLQTAQVLMRVPKPFYLLIFSLTFFEGTTLRTRALREIPDRVEDPLYKDYLIRNRSAATELIEMAPYLPAGIMWRLLNAFREKPHSWQTRCERAFFRTLSRVILSPLLYVRLIRRSQHGSLWRTIRVLPIFLDHAILYYLYHFDMFKRGTRTHEDG